MKNDNFQVLLYYKYVTINDPESAREEQRSLCESLNLKGRIIIAKEGINGTIEGRTRDTEKYIKAMAQSVFFKNISYKKSIGTGDAFPRLSVRVRPEIVTSGISTLNPNRLTGKYISAEELHAWFSEKKEFYIVDMRNDYEYASGYFENFISSGLKNFFDLAKVLPKLAHLKDKTVVTVCTGGIRCEKASGFLVANGFNDVYQLRDGIQSYMEKYPNQHFKGKLYVFDKRLTIGFNTESPKHEIVGKCNFCNKSSEKYVNCEYDDCHRHYICCMDCLDTETGFAFCDELCKENYMNRKIKAPKQQFRVNRNTL